MSINKVEDHQKKRILELNKAGCTSAQIGERVGVSAATVRRQLRILKQAKEKNKTNE